jgi:hypothetical protein
VYELAFNFRVLNVTLSGPLQQWYTSLQKIGKLPKESPDVITDRLKKQVKVIQSNSR